MCDGDLFLTIRINLVAEPGAIVIRNKLGTVYDQPWVLFPLRLVIACHVMLLFDLIVRSQVTTKLAVTVVNNN